MKRRLDWIERFWDLAHSWPDLSGVIKLVTSVLLQSATALWRAVYVEVSRSGCCAIITTTAVMGKLSRRC